MYTDSLEICSGFSLFLYNSTCSKKLNTANTFRKCWKVCSIVCYACMLEHPVHILFNIFYLSSFDFMSAQNDKYATSCICHEFLQRNWFYNVHNCLAGMITIRRNPCPPYRFPYFHLFANTVSSSSICRFENAIVCHFNVWRLHRFINIIKLLLHIKMK